MKHATVSINTLCKLALLLVIAGCDHVATGVTGGTGGTGGTEGDVLTRLVWTPPTTHQDGSHLFPSDIGGYRVYYGTSSGTYIDSIEGVIWSSTPASTASSSATRSDGLTLEKSY